MSQGQHNTAKAIILVFCFSASLCCGFFGGNSRAHADEAQPQKKSGFELDVESARGVLQLFDAAEAFVNGYCGKDAINAEEEKKRVAFECVTGSGRVFMDTEKKIAITMSQFKATVLNVLINKDTNGEARFSKNNSLHYAKLCKQDDCILYMLDMAEPEKSVVKMIRVPALRQFVETEIDSTINTDEKMVVFLTRVAQAKSKDGIPFSMVAYNILSMDNLYWPEIKLAWLK